MIASFLEHLPLKQDKQFLMTLDIVSHILACFSFFKHLLGAHSFKLNTKCLQDCTTYISLFYASVLFLVMITILLLLHYWSIVQNLKLIPGVRAKVATDNIIYVLLQLQKRFLHLSSHPWADLLTQSMGSTSLAHVHMCDKTSWLWQLGHLWRVVMCLISLLSLT